MAKQLMPPRITLVIIEAWRIILARERKVESLAAGHFDDRARALALAGVDAEQFQRGLRAGVLRRCFFPASNGLAAAARDPACHRSCPQLLLPILPPRGRVQAGDAVKLRCLRSHHLAGDKIQRQSFLAQTSERRHFRRHSFLPHHQYRSLVFQSFP